MEHQSCNAVGLHCIRHGLSGCDGTHDHSAECSNCNKFLRSAHALRLWLRNCHNDLCRAFENVLPDWCVRGTSLSDVASGSSIVVSSSCSLSLNGTTMRNGCTAEEVSDTMLEWVQCEDCSKWFTLPDGVTSDALPDVFVCSLRWWDCALQKIKTGYKDDWYN